MGIRVCTMHLAMNSDGTHHCNHRRETNQRATVSFSKESGDVDSKNNNLRETAEPTSDSIFILYF
jgi:hypothetical protein